MAWLTKFIKLFYYEEQPKYVIFCILLYFPETHNILTTFFKHKYATCALKNDCALSIKDYILKKFAR